MMKVFKRWGRMGTVLGVSLLTLFSCEDDLDIDTDKNTYFDDIADITYLNDSFFSTNYDLSGNAGSQIDLLKFQQNADNIYLSDSYDLELNGQGYLAITNDGSDLYLQSRLYEIIIKYSPVGEKAFLRMDDVENGWQASGLAFNTPSDSLWVLYRNLQDLKQYRLRSISTDIIGEISRDDTFDLDFIDRTYHGVYAFDYLDSNFYMLGVDTSFTDLLIIADYNLNIISQEIIPDSTVVGLCFKGDDLYLSYRDKQIKKWSSY